MIKRRHLVQLLAVAPVAAVLPAAVAEPPLESRYAIWRAPEVGEFVIASSAEDAALRYHTHIGWQGTMPQDLGLHPEEWELWPEDKVFPLTEEVDEAEANAAHEAAKDHWNDYECAINRARRLWSPYPGSYKDYPGWKDQAWLFDDEKWPEDKPHPRVIWHIQRRNSKENPQAKNLIWGRTTRMPPAEWVAKLGPGYLGSTEG